MAFDLSYTHIQHRCLRLVSQSWHAFVHDSVYLTKIEKLDCKRQRTSRDINSAGASSSKEYKNGSGCDKEGKNSQKLFLNAKVCLYSLKRTVEDLQKKGLFPYNPKPLLRRFVIWPWLLFFLFVPFDTLFCCYFCPFNSFWLINAKAVAFANLIIESLLSAFHFLLGPKSSYWYSCLPDIFLHHD